MRALETFLGVFVGPGQSGRSRSTEVESGMADAARVLEEALTLTREERAQLVLELVHSLQAEHPDAAALWSDEIRRRLDEIEEGRAELEDWEAVSARLEEVSRG